MIVDCHVHLNNYHEDTVETISARLDELERAMRRHRVDQALILTSYKVTPGRPSTRRVVEAIEGRPHLTVIAGLDWHSFHPDQLEELDAFVRNGRVRGLKLYPGYQFFYPADERWAPAYALAAKHGIPVMIHSGDTYSPSGKVKYSHPLHVDDVAVDFPGVNFVICHLGNPWIRDCMEVVYKNANVFTDISGLVLGDFSDRFERYMRRQFQEMLLYGVEPAKVLYGTDWPISSMESYLAFMQELAIPSGERKRIMADNAIKLYGLAPANGLVGGAGRNRP
jgi:hypothetical protein